MQFIHTSISGRKLCPSRNAFTLIELLVVIAIIAILAAILFPVFAQAKESAKKANCLSNVKNISLAWVMYVSDHDDTIPTGSSLNVDPPTYWFANLDWSGFPFKFDWTKGYLNPYLKNGPIQDCPSAKGLAGLPPDIFVGDYTSYGMNGEVGGGDKNFSQVEQPADTILFGDAGYYTEGKVGKAELIQAVYFDSVGTLHARHSGDTAVVGWMDGHVKAAKIQYRPFAVGAITPALSKSLRLGDLLKTGRRCTSETCADADRVVDFYYLRFQKPTL